MEQNKEVAFCLKIKLEDRIAPMSKYIFLDILSYVFPKKYLNFYIKYLSKKIHNFLEDEETKLIIEKLFFETKPHEICINSPFIEECSLKVKEKILRLLKIIPVDIVSFFVPLLMIDSDKKV